MGREEALRNANVACDDVGVALHLAPFIAQCGDTCVDSRKLRARQGKARVECVEAEQRAVRARDEDVLMPLQAVCVLRSRQGRPDENCRKEREPEREAALPSTTHGATLPTEDSCGPRHKGRCFGPVMAPNPPKSPTLCGPCTYQKGGEFGSESGCSHPKALLGCRTCADRPPPAPCLSTQCTPGEATGAGISPRRRRARCGSVGERRSGERLGEAGAGTAGAVADPADRPEPGRSGGAVQPRQRQVAPNRR